MAPFELVEAEKEDKAARPGLDLTSPFLSVGLSCCITSTLSKIIISFSN